MEVKRLQAALPRAPLVWLSAAIAEMPRWNIDTETEVASFLSQLAHESSEFTHLEENLNYSAERLTQVWPSRFPKIEIAMSYARNPERLANYVYANRIGNGPSTSGDGWRFRGRGPVMITGRTNYAACAKGIGEDLIGQPELLLTPRIGMRSACWYWKSRGLDAHDDDDDALAETRIVNGGTHGLAQRQAYFNKLMQVMGGNV